MFSRAFLLTYFFSFHLSAMANGEFRGIEWLTKYRDRDGCIPLKQLLEKSVKTKECPKEFEPQIRPLTIGTLNRKETDSKNKIKVEFCCFDWRTEGNR